jgi:hypothetical protein
VTHNLAKIPGRLGGRARAKRLSVEHKKKIASLGGRSRSKSLQAARRIVENFLYVAAIRDLAGKSYKIRRVKTFKNRLPGIYV